MTSPKALFRLRRDRCCHPGEGHWEHGADGVTSTGENDHATSHILDTRDGHDAALDWPCRIT